MKFANKSRLLFFSKSCSVYIWYSLFKFSVDIQNKIEKDKNIPQTMTQKTQNQPVKLLHQ